MKQKDIALIIVVAVISFAVALVLSNLLFSTTGSRKQTAETVQPINGSLTTPNTKYFNSSSIDPTQTIRIGDSTNSTPFNNQTQ